MKILGKPTGLVRRKGSTSWYFRQRWPKRFQRVGAANEVWISLETSIYIEALAKIDDARRQAHDIFALSASPSQPNGVMERSSHPAWPSDPALPLLTHEQAATLARRHFREAIAALDLEPSAPAHVTQDHMFALRAELETRLARLTGPEPLDGIDDLHGLKIAVLRKGGLRADPGSEAYNGLHNYLRRSVAQVLRIELARLDEDYSDQIDDRMFAADNGATLIDWRDNGFQPAETAPGVIAETVGNAANAYIETLVAASTTNKTKDRYCAEIRYITAFFGEATQMSSIKRAEVEKFRDAFALLPPNFKNQIKKGRTIPEIVANRADADPVLAWATLDKYLSQLSRFTKWAHRRDYMAKNYGEDLQPLASKPDGSMAKLPFTDAELRRILQRPIYTGCRDDRQGFAKPGNRIIRRARYWAPLIALYGGLRCGEILQLTTDHFRVSPEGNNFIMLTPDMQLKNDNAVREIPVHPVLEQIGFVDWVNRRRSSGLVELFPEVPPHSKYDDKSTRFSKWYQSDLNHFELGDRRKKLTFHSFRHTFKKALDGADIPEEKKEEICGWSRGKKTSRRYGDGLAADVLKASVDAVRYDIGVEHLLLQRRLDG